MVSLVYSSAINGIEANLIEVEAYISSGLPAFYIVGLADTAVKESRDRVSSALRNSGYDFPFQRIVVNLAPADLKKEGGAFDLPIALGILGYTGIIDKEKLRGFCAVGELSLEGRIRRISGVLPMVLGMGKKLQGIIVPFSNRREAAAVKGVNVYPFKTLPEAVDFINGGNPCEPYVYDIAKETDEYFDTDNDFEDVKGQFEARRAAEIAAAGGHNLLMCGPPGSGKTMIAKRISGILPFMTFEESVQTTKIWSAAGKHLGGLIRKRPFRNPHHTASPAALAGGGTYPKPGEVSLANNGVLFLDEFTEFRRDSLEILRQPLEDKCVTISRSKCALTFPASFMLIAAMNPCPCGNFGHGEKECICNAFQIQKYRNRISGPLLDRIDIHINVPALKSSELTLEEIKAESTRAIRERVMAARQIQIERFKGLGIFANAHMNVKDMRKFCRLDEKAGKTLELAIHKLKLSARAYDRILKVSRTIADLGGSEIIKGEHVAEAAQYRALDRNL